eukprot:364228-Chlamydomonas_euryale.AAC.20
MFVVVTCAARLQVILIHDSQYSYCCWQLFNVGMCHWFTLSLPSETAWAVCRRVSAAEEPRLHRHRGARVCEHASVAEEPRLHRHRGARVRETPQ